MTRLVCAAAVFCTIVLAACRTSQTPTSPGPQQSVPSPGTPGAPAPDNGSAGIAYDMTLDIGSECAAVPEAERTRPYTAVFNRATPNNVVTLSGATFLGGPICTAGSGRYSGIGCHQFFASEDIDTVLFWLENNNDEAHGGHIVEQTASGTWLEIIGAASGRGPIGASTIEATGTSTIWYCRTPLAYPFPCPAVAACNSNDMRLTFTRK